MINRATSSANGNSTAAHSNVDVRDVCRVLFRHKRKMIVFFCTALALAVLCVIVYPRTYMSEARLLVRLGKESVALDPTATLSQTVNVEGSRESEINSEIEILRSRVLLEDVIERLGPDGILGSPGPGEGGWMQTILGSATAVSAWLIGDIGPAERAIKKLESVIWVSTPRKSNVISVGCFDRDPVQAQRIVQAFLDSYLLRHVKANRNPASYEFFVDQSNLLRQQLEQATQELRDAKNETGLVSIEGRRESVQAQTDAIEVAMLANQRDLSSSEAKIAALKKALQDLPPQLVAEETGGMPNVAGDLMRSELYKLQILKEDASSRLTSEHPQAIVLRRQLAETQKIFDEQEARRSLTTRKLSPVHQGVHAELMSAQALDAAQKAEAQTLERQYAAIQSRIRTLNDNDFHIAELTRRTELVENNYRSYTNNLEQARIDQALETGRVSNINVVQPASFVAKPTSPRFQIVFILGLIVGTLGAVLLAFGAEYFDRSVKTPEQIEHELGIPVLFSIPRGVRYDLLSN